MISTFGLDVFLLPGLGHQDRKPIQEPIAHRIKSGIAAFGVDYNLN